MSSAVVVPLYRTFLDPTESIALTQCCRVLRRHAIVFAAPEGLDLAPALALARAAGVSARVERYADRWFRSTATYNALLLWKGFYQRYAQYDYILIHQLDAFAFADELDRFCGLGYDYIGAPWTHDPAAGGVVGNGGFSLRKVASALRVLELPASRVPQFLALQWRRHGLLRRTSAQWLQRTGRLHRSGTADDFMSLATSHLLHVNEDGFWGQNCDRLPFFHTAPYRDALAFAFEVDPHTALERNGGRLPFGCHAWPYIAQDFWQPYINACGYDWKLAA